MIDESGWGRQRIDARSRADDLPAAERLSPARRSELERRVRGGYYLSDEVTTAVARRMVERREL